MIRTPNNKHEYPAGDWKLPKWWTDGAPYRIGYKPTYEDHVAFYSGPFVTKVLGHKGGITTLPTMEKDDDR